MDLTSIFRHRAIGRVVSHFRGLRSPLVRRRPERAPLPVEVAELSGTLRAFRAAALWLIATVVTVADGAAFSESYRGLFEWAEHHSLSGFWAAAFPLAIDTFIVVGELVLFVAMLDRWGWRDRLGAWAVALLGLAVSIAGNIGHVHAHDLQTRGTAAVPPVAAFGALWLGLGVLKRILRRRRQAAAQAAQVAQATAERDALAEQIAALAGAVQALAAPRAQDDTHSMLLAGRLDTQTELIAELTAAVRDLSARPDGTSREPVADDAESAALASYRATLQAGNPWSQRQLETRFGLTRTQASRVRDQAHAEPSDAAPAEDYWAEPVQIRYAALNGASAGD